MAYAVGLEAACGHVAAMGCMVAALVLLLAGIAAQSAMMASHDIDWNGLAVEADDPDPDPDRSHP